MNTSESFLSNTANANTGTSAMARIVANVVDMQQQLVSQYQTVVNALESLKDEVHNANKSMKDDLRRVDDRAQKQVDDLRITHANEVERLMDLIKTLLTRDGFTNSTQAVHVEPQRITQAQVYASAPPPNYFGTPANALNDFAAQAQAHYAACYLQQLEQQRLRAGGLPAAGYFGSQQGIMGNMCHPGAFSQGQQNASMFTTSAPKLSNEASVLPPIPVTASVQSSMNASLSLSGSASHIATSNTTTTISPSGPFTAAPIPVITTPSISTSQPSKIEPTKTEKPDLISPKPPFTFTTPKSEATETKVELTKPVNILSEIKSPQKVFPTSPEVKHTAKQESGDGYDEGDHDHVEEFEPQIDFKPVCPLPELVKVVTGEENEKELFGERCKLYRYADETNEWKERGTGVMKVLENNENKKCRIVMRREQVHKVCANHQLLPGMTIQAMPRQEKAMIWYCEDFSEEQKSHEKLSARFASVEVANKFKDIFENAVRTAEQSSIAKPSHVKKEGKVEISTKGGARKEKSEVKESGKTENGVSSKDSEKSLAVEKSPVVEEKGYGEQFKLQPGQWECPECYTRSAGDKCPCCGSSRSSGKTGDATAKSVFPTSTIPLSGFKTTETNAPKFTFGISAAAAAKESPAPSPSVVTKSPLFGGSLASTASPPSGTLSFGSKPSIFGGATVKPTTAGSSNSSTPVGSSVFGGNRLFGTSKAVEEKKEGEKGEKNSAEQMKSEQKVFGGGSVPNPFSAYIKSGTSIFDPVYTQKAQAEFAEQAKSKLAVTDKNDPVKTSSLANKGDSADGEKEHGADEEFEPNVDFVPAIPLPDLVDVVTGEEGEQVIFTGRAKLYRFVKEIKENKERGVGELKILRNPKTNAHRVVMRRDHVHKVCANFAILPSMELNERKGVQHAYTWICRDYAESREGTDEIFTIKFKTAEIAKEFHDKFIEAAAAHADSN